MPQTIGSLSKALDLIDVLAEQGTELGISELSRRLDLSKNQVFRILKTLEEHGYAHQVENRAYRLGFRFFSVGQQVVGQADVVQIALPLMDELRNATGESVHLLVLDGDQAVCTARRESPALIRMSAEIGRRFLLHAGACPKAIFAFQSSVFIESTIARHGLPRYTEHTITEASELKEHLADIRARGYSISDEDIDVHAFAVAVPIYDRAGSVDAAMSIAGPATRFADEKRARALELLVDACDRVSTALGSPKRPSAGIADLVFEMDALASEKELPLTKAG